MANRLFDVRFILLSTATVFILIQVYLFTRQSNYADRLESAVESENRCTSQMRHLISQISLQKGKIVSLEEEKERLFEECAHLKALVQDFEKRTVQVITTVSKVPIAAVVIMACNRADYLERTINSILKYQGMVASKFPLFVSQDGPNQDVKAKALSYNQITYMQHLDFQPVHTERPGELTAYYKIANHYKWALDNLFFNHNFSRVIILEDDMEIALDFFDYFEATAQLLDHDKSIMAVSSWNDNGQKPFVYDSKTLYRSDFFPGLGWMLTKTIWNELSPKWPKAYWDDWIRLKDVHKDRQFIHPEICRTYNFGEHGSSMGQFFKQYLESIKLNDEHVDWKTVDLNYLTEDNFLNYFAKLVSDAKAVSGHDAVLQAYNIDGDMRIPYNDQSDYERIARQFGIFEEWKDGIPRTAYKGVVVFRYQTSRRIFLVGPDSLRQLGISSS
ncbi:Alpha-1,3-mannosyl-glycoprotein 2-beta-N-acetylglucosaminyltransferase, family GT13 [Zostera marina]|uniref:Alpha-1,3-mannosyl-glycoprotein 2-beta-N-acetylglucosaminyltransferase n=1 Tax=Zostera marina TaxID=29655 RepID=A0A0K9NNT5_ZOSMR|nr:Alpha-1,3-mannosyl-glycoprotein 2-beta-N-acetylglucosaminyltransferase, family GT13 [Zostera marina]